MLFLHSNQFHIAVSTRAETEVICIWNNKPTAILIFFSLRRLLYRV